MTLGSHISPLSRSYIEQADVVFVLVADGTTELWVQGMNADVLSAIGSANLKLGRLNQAETILHRAIEADETNVPALNNLGCVLMEQFKYGEARRVFQEAFMLDSGQSDSIRENLKRAIAQSESTVYDRPEEKPRFNLVRRGNGEYLLLSDL